MAKKIEKQINCTKIALTMRINQVIDFLGIMATVEDIEFKDGFYHWVIVSKNGQTIKGVVKGPPDPDDLTLKKWKAQIVIAIAIALHPKSELLFRIINEG